jgi:hypothetical protein
MAAHEVPDDGTVHKFVRECPCVPEVVRRRRGDGFMQTVIVHRDQRPEDLLDDQGPEAECGHVIIRTDAGEEQHHEIPDDGAPHAPTSECGCAPQREDRAGHIVYAHADQDADPDAGDDDWEGGPQ